MELDQADHCIQLKCLINSPNGEKEDFSYNLEKNKTIEWWHLLKLIYQTDISFEGIGKNTVMKITGVTSNSHSLTMVVNLKEFKLTNDNNQRVVVENDKEIESYIFNEVESGIVIIEITPRGKHNIVVISSLNY
jgi:hypothetical protein